MDYKLKLSEAVKIEGLSKEEVHNLLTPSISAKMGDYSLPCFTLAKQLKQSPIIIANSVASKVNTNELIARVEAVNGYVNFFLNRANVTQAVVEAVLNKKENFAKQNLGNNKTIVMDYSSVNIAKQMHIGHLYTTAIGNALNQMYKYMGYRTVGLNYLGDFGVQFGEIIAAHKTFGSEDELLHGGIEYIQKMYAKSKSESKENEEFAELGKYWFHKIETRDKEAIRLFEIFKTITLAEVKPIFDLLNISFDEWKGELYYSDKMDAVLDELEQKNLLQLSRGRKIVNLEEDNLNVAVIVKEDGTTRYITRDLAAAIDRFNTYQFDKCLYITAYEQNLHFAQLFQILQKMGYEFSKNMVHVSYGRVSLPEGKLSSRGGAKALLKDIFNESIKRAEVIINEKNASLNGKKEVAKAVGVGAVIFGALNTQKIKDTVFNMEDALSFEGETAPYMQYTYARCASVLRKLQNRSLSEPADYTQILGDEAFEIVKTLNNFTNIIADVLEKFEPSILSKALMGLSKNFNKFYHDYKILDENDATTKARVNLTIAVKTALKLGLNLLGISVVEEM
jgi:arginyl-tRNA synthetase